MTQNTQRSILAAVWILAALLTSPISAQNYLNQPEGIAYDSVNNRWLVSNWADGRIVQIDSNGVQSYFKTGLGNCAGLHIVGNTVYVASNNNRIIGLDLSTAATVMTRDFAAAGGCHDITSDTSGYLYATDWGRNRIYKVNPVTNTYTVFVSSGLNQPLGIHFDKFGNRLLVTSMADNVPIQSVDVNDSTVSTVVYTDWPQDGITEDGMGNYYITSLTDGFDVHSVYRFDSTFSYYPEVITGGYYGLCDACYNPEANILAVTSYWDNSIDFIPIYGSVRLSAEEFSDQTFGDGDGLLEGGETIELVLTLANNGPRPVGDLSVNFNVDDAALNVIQGTSYLGDIPSGGTVDNGGDPFIFEIPDGYIPRLCSFNIEAIWTCDFGGEVDTITMEKGIGGISILLVDDDGGNNIDDYYVECLRSLSIPYDLFVTGDSVCPEQTVLDAHSIVIWFTGDYRSTPLSSDEVASMTYFMDGGGKLFLTGQRIAAQLNSENPVFLNNYLKAQYLSTSAVPLLSAQPGGAVFDVSDTVSLQGAGSAANQLAPDHLASVGGAGELAYAGSTDLGTVSYSGDYSMIFFSFGFEAIGDPRWRDQKTIMTRILDYFGYQYPSTPLEITVSPGDPTHLLNHTPIISWTCSCPKNNAQAYQVQVGDDNDWETAEMWDTGPVTGTESEITYAGNSLEDGQTYYIRVKTSDGVSWSNWYYRQIRMNSMPSTPRNLSPDNGQEFFDTPPILSHDNAVDNEGDRLTYSYEVYDDSLMSSLVMQASDYPEDTGTITSWQPSEVLPGNENYFWRVRADDGFESGAWSELASFVVVAAYVCGDANADGQVNVADAVFLINYVFKGGAAPEPLEAGDANCDGQPNVADAVYLINYVFKGGDAPCATCP